MTDDERKERRIRNYYDDVMPLAADFIRLVRTSGMTDMAAITVDPRTGYIHCHLHESDINMFRLDEDAEFKIERLEAGDD